MRYGAYLVIGAGRLVTSATVPTQIGSSNIVITDGPVTTSSIAATTVTHLNHLGKPSSLVEATIKAAPGIAVPTTNEMYPK